MGSSNNQRAAKYYRGLESHISYINRSFREVTIVSTGLSREPEQDVILSRRYADGSGDLRDWLEFHAPPFSTYGLEMYEMYDVYMGSLGVRQAIVFRFQKPSDAVLFKLTFGEYDVTSEWVQ